MNQTKRTGWVTVLLVALMAGLLGFALVTYILSDKRSADPATQIQTTAQTVTGQTGQANSNAQSARPQAANEKDNSAVTNILGGNQPLPGQARSETWMTVIPRIVSRLLLAALLAAMLAFRPRRDLHATRRNLFVAQTQILLAVVASALMMIVGDNAARAFGIFAAASLVRFRTNIRDPKETTVLLIGLSLGLATGVGHWDVAVILTLFVLPLLWLLESRESQQVFRSMELTVRTRDTNSMQNILKRVFQQHGFNAELRQINPPDEEEPVGCVMYSVNMNLSFSTDQISDEIRALDPKNIEGIEWEQKKDASYIYQ
ncbi:MAG: hypothetical protein QOJ02_4159 [Acidobacteriota bacterium]|jgi:uncharacterized membrane protein YhiD involved in acid resistance|nr:hypothetical protein [Acidobacteriota bacterium]